MDREPTEEDQHRLIELVETLHDMYHDSIFKGGVDPSRVDHDELLAFTLTVVLDAAMGRDLSICQYFDFVKESISAPLN